MKVEEYANKHLSSTLYLLKSAFGENKELEDSSELVLRVVVCHPYINDMVIAHAASYIRKMSHQDGSFLGGIIGDVAVHPEHQKQGLTREMLSVIHEYFNNCGVDYSFLFAYNPDIYKSSGYNILNIPINYYDVEHKSWKRYIYNGAMFRSFNDKPLDEEINFCGRTY